LNNAIIAITTNGMFIKWGLKLWSFKKVNIKFPSVADRAPAAEHSPNPIPLALVGNI
jgi:hypothetical protein